MAHSVVTKQVSYYKTKLKQCPKGNIVNESGVSYSVLQTKTLFLSIYHLVLCCHYVHIQCIVALETNLFQIVPQIVCEEIRDRVYTKMIFQAIKVVQERTKIIKNSSQIYVEIE